MLPEVWLCPHRTGLFDWSKDACFVAINLCQAFWMCCLLLDGIGELDSASHAISAEATDWSGTDLMLLGRMDFWRVSVVAAEARKAEDASI